MKPLRTLFVLCAAGCIYTSFAQTTFTISNGTTGSQTYGVSGGTVVVSAGVTVNVKIEVWGAGAGGGQVIFTSRGRPTNGGGGGGYTTRDTILTAGTYTVTVGAGGGTGANGGSSSFNGTINATGGSRSGTPGTGDYSGGAGAAASGTNGGGGGEGACTTANGQAGGVGGTRNGGSSCDGGDGGKGGTSGQSGTGIGAGGGGCGTSVATSVSGSGTDGQVTVTIVNALPVTYTFFKVETTQTNKARLLWQTASELNNDRFEIEKSIENQDFQTIGVIQGSGTSNQLIDYAFIDNDVSGNSCYRIKQVDYDGHLEFSALACFTPKLRTEISIFPNPFKNYIRISGLNAKKQTKVELLDMQGRTLLSEIHNNTTDLEISTEMADPGSYILKVNGQASRVVKY